MRISFAGTKLHKFFVEKNKYIENEYNNYIKVNSQDGKRNTILEWLFLARVNVAYFLLNRRSSDDVFNVFDNTKLPYLDGAESTITNQVRPYHLARNLLSYDVISFDIFDTLIFRPFRQPQDLFHIIAGRLDFEGFNENFYNLRRDAEAEARAEKDKQNGHREINIYEIYEQIAKKTNIPVDEGVNAEFQAELDYCFANPYMKEVFQILLSQKKRIILTSDMYLPSELMEKLLKKNGFDGYEKIYVSCDYKVSKGNGLLYDSIKGDYKNVDPKNIMHIGDNAKSDIQMAKKKGLSVYHYQNVNEIGNKYRPDNMSVLTGSFYTGIINSFLYNGKKQYSFFYEYGFVYMGINILGMCNWIHKKAEQESIDKILFMSRDGFLYQKVFNLFFHDIDNQYCFWSRNAAMKYVVCKRNYNEFLKRYIDYRIIDSPDEESSISIKSLLETLELLELLPELKRYELDQNFKITRETEKALKMFFQDHYKYILKKYELGNQEMQQIYKDAIGDSKKVALIDVGWTGHNLLNLKYLLQHDLKLSCDIQCWMAAEKGSANPVALLKSNIDSYMFASYKNREIIEKFYNATNNKFNSPFFELGTQPDHPSFDGIANNKLLFDIPIVEDYDFSREIERGIMDFCKIFWSKSIYDPELRNISGFDAYAPFSMAVKDLRFIYKNFNDLHISINIGSDTSMQNVEKLWSQFQVYQKGGK